MLQKDSKSKPFVIHVDHLKKFIFDETPKNWLKASDDLAQGGKDVESGPVPLQAGADDQESSVLGENDDEDEQDGAANEAASTLDGLGGTGFGDTGACVTPRSHEHVSLPKGLLTTCPGDDQIRTPGRHTSVTFFLFRMRWCVSGVWCQFGSVDLKVRIRMRLPLPALMRLWMRTIDLRWN